MHMHQGLVCLQKTDPMISDEDSYYCVFKCNDSEGFILLCLIKWRHESLSVLFFFAFIKHSHQLFLSNSLIMISIFIFYNCHNS